MTTPPSLMMLIYGISLSTTLLSNSGCALWKYEKIGHEGMVVTKTEMFSLISKHAESNVNEMNLRLLDKSYYLPHKSEIAYILDNWMHISPDHDYNKFDDCDDYAFDFVTTTRKYYRTRLYTVNAQAVGVFFWVVRGHALAMIYCVDGPVWIEPQFPLKGPIEKPQKNFVFAL